jgi:putative flippase GtrA
MQDRRIGTKFVRYFLTSGTAAIADTGGFALLMLTSMAIWLAASLSFICAAVINYLLSAVFAFGHRPTLRGFATFFAGAIIGFAINISVTVLLATRLGVPPIAAKIGGVGTAFTANFLINLLVVFRHRQA